MDMAHGPLSMDQNMVHGQWSLVHGPGPWTMDRGPDWSIVQILSLNLNSPSNIVKSEISLFLIAKWKNCPYEVPTTFDVVELFTPSNVVGTS